MLQLKPKQQTVIDAINDPNITVIVLIGSMGTGKSYIAAHGFVSLAYAFEGSNIAVIRKNLSTAKKTIVPTYQEVLYDSNFIEGKHYTLSTQPPEIRFKHNRSLIQFVEADHTKDRQLAKIKGLNLTVAHIDEADEIIEYASNMVYSRIGRANKNGQPKKLILTMNPNDAWTKERFYDLWKANNLPSNVCVIEFEPGDSWLGDDYYRGLEDNPIQWKQRYLYNNWDYGDDEAALFKYRHMDRQHVQTYTKTVGYIGKDVARSGKDRSIISLWYGRCLVDIKIIKDKEDVIDTSVQGDKLKEYALANEVGYDHIAVDAVGVGVGVIDHLKAGNYYVNEFMSGATPSDPRYNNLRSEMAFKLAQDIEKGDVTFYDGCPYLKEFKKEATAHNYETKDKQFVLESKDKVKERLGFSPDIFDAVIMGYWMVCKYDSLKFVPRTSGDSVFKKEQKTVVRRRRGL